MRIKSLTERFYTHLYTDGIYPDTDTDDKNSPNVIELVPFFTRIRNADTDTDPETWNRALTPFALLCIPAAWLICQLLYKSVETILLKLYYR